ncbi:MAG: hypothetical protein VKL20_08170 [Synechocystis sp.]|nr:hypothetical protein [Synechocystis sp.]
MRKSITPALALAAATNRITGGIAKDATDTLIPLNGDRRLISS